MNGYHVCPKCDWIDAQVELVDDPETGKTVAVRFTCGWCQQEDVVFHGSNNA